MTFDLDFWPEEKIAYILKTTRQNLMQFYTVIYLTWLLSLTKLAIVDLEVWC